METIDVGFTHTHTSTHTQVHRVYDFRSYDEQESSKTLSDADVMVMWQQNTALKLDASPY